MKLREKPEYAKMFEALATRTVEQLKEILVLTFAMKVSYECSTIRATTYEELCLRIGEDEAIEYFDSLFE